MSCAIRVEKLSKRYRLAVDGGHGHASSTLRAELARLVRWPWRRGEGRGELWALRDVSFELAPGQVLGILGRNGAGKSTLLKVLSRITPPTSGRALVRGRVGSLLEVGTGFHPELTGRENIYLNGSMLQMSHREVRRKFDAIVAFAEVERFLDVPVKMYSSGMSVRLAFSVAAHVEPEVLIVDEVLAVGDLAFQRKVAGKVQEIMGQGRTVLFVNHNVAAMKAVCTHGLLLEKGMVAFEGPIQETIDAYHELHGLDTLATGIIPDSALRSCGTLEAKFRSVRLARRDGRPTGQLHYGSPFRVLLEFEVLHDVPDAVLEVGVVTPHGEQVTFSSTLDGGRPPLALARGRYSATVEVHVALMPRDYSLLLGLSHLNGTTIDRLERALSFTVRNVAEDGDHFHWSPVRGYVRAPARWDVARAA
jgi:lipopolysaccharide transport system ATP-binding protein